LLVFLLPPPASGALRLAGSDRPRARRAPDRDEALGVQRVDRHVVGGRAGEHLLARPVEQRAELEQVAPDAGRIQRPDVAAARRRARPWGWLDGSARSAAIHPVAPASARLSGSTLRTWQQLSRASRES